MREFIYLKCQFGTKSALLLRSVHCAVMAKRLVGDTVGSWVTLRIIAFWLTSLEWISWCVTFLMVFNTPCDHHNRSIAISMKTHLTESSRTGVHIDRQGAGWEVRAANTPSTFPASLATEAGCSAIYIPSVFSVSNTQGQWDEANKVRASGLVALGLN